MLSSKFTLKVLALNGPVDALSIKLESGAPLVTSPISISVSAVCKNVVPSSDDLLLITAIVAPL